MEKIIDGQHIDVAYLVHGVGLLLSQEYLIVGLLSGICHLSIRLGHLWILLVLLVLFGLSICAKSIIIIIHAYHTEGVKITLLTAEADPHLKVMIVTVFIHQVVLVAQPWVLQDARDRDALAWLHLQHALDKVSSLVRDWLWIVKLARQDQSVEGFKRLGLERYCSLEHGV